MIKTFYKRRPEKKVFFRKDVKVRSYAYGEQIHLDFIEWRRRFIAKWNSSSTNFLTLENGAIDGNRAKMDKVGELRVTVPAKGQKAIKTSSAAINPLWFDGHYLEVGEYGELILDGKETDTVLGSELKGWGIGTVWNRNQPSHTLYVLGKNEKGASQLRAYAVDSVDGYSLRLVASIDTEATLSRKSQLYCFGAHIFFVNDSRLNYYYLNLEFSRLEEVALESDSPNADKDFCSGVSGNVVCDADGYVYWRSGNGVVLFPIGYPKKLERIEFGERTELTGIQVLCDRLFVYCRSRITREFTCLSYCVGKNGIYDAEIFNRGSKYNLFYAEKNGILHYVKIPPASRKAYVAKSNSGNETVVAEIDISGAEEMFCVAGDLYLNCSYVGNIQKD